MAADLSTSAPERERRRWRGARKPRNPDVIVVGSGVAGMQLTLAGHAAILGSGVALTVGVAPQVVDHLRAARVRVAELDDVVAAAATPTDGYLGVIDAVLSAASTSPPAVLVVPGSPLSENSITRALVALCRERDLQVELHASVSPVDALVNDLGVDVTGRGLQVFSAPSLLARGIVPNPDVPLVVTSLALLTDPAAGAAGLQALTDRLAHVYPGDHAMTLVTEVTGRGSLAHRTLPLDEAIGLWTDIGPGSALYVNPRTRQAPARTNPKPPEKGGPDE